MKESIPLRLFHDSRGYGSIVISSNMIRIAVLYVVNKEVIPMPSSDMKEFPLFLWIASSFTSAVFLYMWHETGKNMCVSFFCRVELYTPMVGLDAIEFVTATRFFNRPRICKALLDVGMAFFC